MKSDAFKTRSEIAEELNISTKTLYRKIKKKGLQIPGNTYLTKKEYNSIYQALDIDLRWPG